MLVKKTIQAATWRQLWIWLAEAERELGLDELISKGMIDLLKLQKDNIDWDEIKKMEKALKHDVMAHIKAYGKVGPLCILFLHLFKILRSARMRLVLSIWVQLRVLCRIMLI